MKTFIKDPTLTADQLAAREARKALLLRQAARLAAERDVNWLIKMLRKLREQNK